ncbi:DNRLRE domain-containing protein [Sporocytophaga myxococcoides]|uniref:DNRLRE domain-containing protein n=1 Tax=Sporocytophaga myxococcoides TaxID=153721 RepID=UPI00041EF3B3|nr:DNRLRE domain-containing protein [Sporocytophaga myxococcoides]
MFILKTSKCRIFNRRTRNIIGTLLFIAGIILSESCSHPICDGVRNDSTGRKQVIFQNLTLRPGTEGIDAIVISYYPETNFGNSKTLSATILGKERNRYLEKGYIDFDLSDVVPSDAKIKKSTLKLYADTVNQINKDNIPKGHYMGEYTIWNVSFVKRPWDEKNITWFNQLTIPTEELMIIDVAERNDQAFLLDVTEYVKKKVRRDPDVHGLVLDVKWMPMEGSIRFCSSDHQNNELRPALYIEYEIER